MSKWPDLIGVMIALAAIVGSECALGFRAASMSTIAIEGGAAAALARSQALAIAHLGSER